MRWGSPHELALTSSNAKPRLWMKNEFEVSGKCLTAFDNGDSGAL